MRKAEGLVGQRKSYIEGCHETTQSGDLVHGLNGIEAGEIPEFDHVRDRLASESQSQGSQKLYRSFYSRGNM
jgi:hypothetical protein